jgi:hypothetical protein
MSNSDLILTAIGLTAAGILLFRDWRVTVPLLLANALAVAALLNEQPVISADITTFGISTLVLVKLLAGVTVSLILALTALTFSRDYGLENLDEFGQAELRRALRAAIRVRASQPFLFSDYVVPFWSGVLALIASLTLPLVYPIAPSIGLDFAWYWLALTGLLTIASAGDVLKIGMGLLLCVSGIDLLYSAVVSTPAASGLKVAPVALLSIVNILLALGIAYLSGLVYGRLKTLELSELYKR